MRTIQYSTPEQQIELLKSRGLIISNESFTINALSSYGYYNIINGYKRPYSHVVDGSRTYNVGVTFEQIYSLAMLDRNIRNSVMSSLLDLEEALRAAMADVICTNISIDHNEYLRKEHYQARSNKIYRFSTPGLLDSLKTTLTSGKDPIRYYSDNYDVVPPWILFKGVYFSTLINLARILKPSDKSALIQRMYGADNSHASLKCVKEFFQCSLFICLDYRNRAAHGGRIYDFDSDHAFYLEQDNDFYSVFPSMAFVKDSSGIGRLMAILGMFCTSNAEKILRSAVDSEINRHLTLFPQDKDILESLIRNKIQFVQNPDS